MKEKHSILLVDDDPFILKGIGLSLETHGYGVTTTDGGRAAVELLKKKTFDLVITDLIMDEINGIEVLKICKKIHPETMVIILTGYADMDSAINALRLNADDYMLKPCEPDEVFFRVQRCLDKLRMQREITRFYIELENRVTERTGELIRINKKLMKEIEHRKQVEQSLQKSQEKYRNVVEHSNDGICIVQDYEMKYVNRRLAEILGYNRDEMLKKDVGDFFGSGEMVRIREIYEDFMSRKTDEQRMETLMIHQNGHPIEVELSISMTTYDDHRAGLVSIHDISERKRAERQVHNLTRQLLAVQESERHKIACDLHDHIAQDLASLKIGCGMLTQTTRNVSQDFREKTAELSDILQKVIMEVRNLAYTLYPTGLRQFGLIETLYRHCGEFADKNDIRVSFVTAGLDDLQLDYEKQINLYRLVQEALNNIKKHADARSVNVRMVASHPNIILRIEDDGKGFDVEKRFVEALQEERMGLQSMQERVNMLNGEFKIQSRPMEGTRIVVEFPYKRDDALTKPEETE